MANENMYFGLFNPAQEKDWATLQSYVLKGAFVLGLVALALQPDENGESLLNHLGNLIQCGAPPDCEDEIGYLDCLSHTNRDTDLCARVFC